jgi:endonuclease/exonuclease/phosphatase family metal-dependent hydrolase
MLRRISPYASLVASAASCASHCSRSGCKASASSSSASSSSASSSAATIRIATYNVLSDKLCRASHYPENSEDDLDNEKRLERVKAKLAEEMDKRAVVCLQEVSRHWGDKLVPFFEQRGYSYAGANYGNPFNGYMGCYVAWPRERYDAIDMDCSRISDTVDWGVTDDRTKLKSSAPAAPAASATSKAAAVLSKPSATRAAGGRSDPDFAKYAYKSGPSPPVDAAAAAAAATSYPFAASHAYKSSQPAWDKDAYKSSQPDAASAAANEPAWDKNAYKGSQAWDKDAYKSSQPGAAAKVYKSSPVTYKNPPPFLEGEGGPAPSARATSPAVAAPAALTLGARLAAALGALVGFASSFGASPAHQMRERGPFKPWDVAKKRHNCAVMVRLKQKTEAAAAGGGATVAVSVAAAAAAAALAAEGGSGGASPYVDANAATLATTTAPVENGGGGGCGGGEGGEFVVATYHMPCLFGSDEKCAVMVAHAALLMQHAQRFAGGAPLVVCGDFNIQPGQPTYRLVLDGGMPATHPQHPPSPALCLPKQSNSAAGGQQDGWTASFEPMRSAYLDFWGEEPSFTNYALSGFNKDAAFQETLDYVFFSQNQWRVLYAKELPTRESVAHLPGFPSADEPSDHILLAVELGLLK